MLTAGPRARFGLLSPSDRAILRGDPLTVGLWHLGSPELPRRICRRGRAELPREIGDYVDRLVAPYFEAVAEWFQALRVGQKAGVLTRSSSAGWAIRSSAFL